MVTVSNMETTVELRPKQPTAQGPAEWFTGDVWIDSIVSPRARPAR